MGLQLVPLTPEIYRKYCVAAHARKQPQPAKPSEGVWVVDDTDNSFVAGVGVFPCDGPFALAEDLIVSDTQPLRKRHEAVQLIASALKVYASVTGKRIRMMIASKGAAMIAIRNGAAAQPAIPILYKGAP